MKRTPMWRKCEQTIFKYYNEHFGKKSTCFRLVDNADINRQGYKLGQKFVVTNIKNPSDLIITANGITFYAEVKCTSNPRGVTSSLLGQQNAAIKRIIAAGGMYMYYIFHETTHQWYIVPSEAFAKSKNISWKDLTSYKNNVIPLP